MVVPVVDDVDEQVGVEPRGNRFGCVTGDPGDLRVVGHAVDDLGELEDDAFEVRMMRDECGEQCAVAAADVADPSPFGPVEAARQQQAVHAGPACHRRVELHAGVGMGRHPGEEPLLVGGTEGITHRPESCRTLPRLVGHGSGMADVRICHPGPVVGPRATSCPSPPTTDQSFEGGGPAGSAPA